MREDEIELVLNHLARECPASSKPDFSSKEQLDLAIKRVAEVAELNRQTSQLIKEGRRRGRLIDIRLAVLRWRLNGRLANPENPGGMKCL